ncbi:MAG TPA: protein kinase, partial [Longimicrobiales bacterium]
MKDRLVGATLGPFRVRSTLGSGGMGTVYLASLEKDIEGMARGQRVALKCIHRHLVDSSAGYVQRFLREAEVGRRIDHPNVVRVLGSGKEAVDGGDVYYIAMEHVEGETLGRILGITKCPVPEALCRHIGGEVARGLAAIHTAGIVHRDLKLDNV